jgi:MoaA/NifB/PqqE/SkfB family radical SAM enzyme
LIVNAATVLHLNQTATEYARLLIEGIDEEQVARTMAARYRVGREQAQEDYHNLREKIVTLATTVDLDPVTYLDMEQVAPFSAHTRAPYRADLALTYRIDATGTLDPEARRRVDRELTTAEWEQILWQLWNAGVPHAVFTGGEPTLRMDLVELVRYAEGQGMVTGLLTNGRCLRDPEILNGLLLAGLDHVQITLISHEPDTHDAVVGQAGAWEETIAGLRAALAGDIYVVVHVVILPQNVGMAAETVRYVAQLGVPAVALSSPLRAASKAEQAALEETMADAQDAAYRSGLRLVWDLAAPYSYVNPIALEAGLEPDQIARQHLYVEPDGDVLPAQGYNVVLGNLLNEPWETIWNHPARRELGQAESE